MQINSSVSSASSSMYNIDEMDSKLGASILSAKDTDSSGDLSASELNVTSDQLAEFDTDGDGVLSSAELAAALKSQREKMQSQMDSQMQQSSQLGMLQSTMGQPPSDEAPSLDNVIQGLFSDSDSDSGSESVSASTASASSVSSGAGDSLSSLLENLESQLVNSIFAEKDTDGDGTLSAEELGATAEQLSELDLDGDGVVSDTELSTGLKAQREEMMAESGGVMPPPPPPTDESGSTSDTTSTTSATTGTTAASTDSLSMDALMQSMFSSTSSGSISSSDSTDTTSVTASFLSEFMLRQKATSAYQNVDSLISGLFGAGDASQSVSLSA